MGSNLERIIVSDTLTCTQRNNELMSLSMTKLLRSDLEVTGSNPSTYYVIYAQPIGGRGELWDVKLALSSPYFKLYA